MTKICACRWVLIMSDRALFQVVTVWAILIVFIVIMFLVAGCEPQKEGRKQTNASGTILVHADSVQAINVYSKWKGPKWPTRGGPASDARKIGPGSRASKVKGFCTIDYPAELSITTYSMFTTTSETTIGRGECRQLMDNQAATVKTVKRLGKSGT